MSLTDATTDTLARELRLRMRELGEYWPDEVYGLVTDISVIPCVDGFPIRWNERDFQLEMGFIRRNTGQYKGRWWCVGGRIIQGESFSAALIRHVRETLGVGMTLPETLSWNTPVCVAQHAPQELPLYSGEYAGHEPSKYCTSSTYVILLGSEEVRFGSTEHGGQEASELRWFPVEDLPSGEDLAYQGEATVRACRKWAGENILALMPKRQ